MNEAAGTTERTTWVQSRPEARVAAGGGMVAAKTEAAAQVGAEVLRGGGNAVDAAVATAFAAGVVEPWMNGLGGGGFLVAHRPGQEPVVVGYPMVSPAAARPELFPLAGAPPDSGLFGWPSVVDAANIVGHRAPCVPGTPAGLALATERLGTWPLADLIAPAARLAEEGVPVTWHTTLTVARDLGTLARFPATAAIYLDAQGHPPVTVDQARPTLLRQPDLARTLRTIAEHGPRAFYEGPIAEAIAGHLAANGGPMTAADLAGYAAAVEPPLTVPYRGHEVLTSGGASGGATLAQTLLMLGRHDIAGLGHNSPAALHLLAQAFRSAFADRFAYLADPNGPDGVDVPLAALLSPEYAAERAAAFRPAGFRLIAAGARDRLGVRHALASSVPDYASGGSTTHFCAVDKDGMAVSVTQTLLALWGSRVVVPGTGVLLNNGMMWFDPEPGRPNSVAGGKRPLSNMAPAVVTRGGAAVAALGASGGRLIMNCNAQLIMNLVDHGLTMQPAIAAPRIDASTPDLRVSSRLPEATRDALAALGHPTQVRTEDPGGSQFASPVGIQREPDGALRGGADLFYPAMAIGVPPD